MNKKQKENWISIDEIKEKYNVLSGVIMPPRRSLDYSEMKIRSFDTKTH